jgi:hypothetical protein
MVITSADGLTMVVSGVRAWRLAGDLARQGNEDDAGWRVLRRGPLAGEGERGAEGGPHRTRDRDDKGVPALNSGDLNRASGHCRRDCVPVAGELMIARTTSCCWLTRLGRQ